MKMLTIEQIKVGSTADSKAAAITQAGQLLAQNGVVEPSYVDGMHLREATMSTYIGNGVAIPHGTHDHISHINHTGISVLQVPKGVDWGDDEMAYLVIGIAANSDDHMDILVNLAEIMEDEAAVEQLVNTADPQIILDMLSREPVP